MIFNIPESTDCKELFVTIFEKDNPNNMLNRFCGNYPPEIVSAGDEIHIRKSSFIKGVAGSRQNLKISDNSSYILIAFSLFKKKSEFTLKN